jgi:UDP-N-acetylmuramoyl-tripeptide--D-alanyl-D-alanine ligase
MYILLNTLWFIWIIKYVLFWLYLWQLKEYHIGRFVDHFRTIKGKKLIFGFEPTLKLLLLLCLFLFPELFGIFFYAIILIYFYESILTLRGILNKSIKFPKITKKTLFLSGLSFTIVGIFLVIISGSQDAFILPVALLSFDILTPIIISVVALSLQPLTVWLRNKTLKRAKERLDEIRYASNLKVIAITGSYGKTSTKEFLSTILSKKFNVLSTREHQNSELGIARSILEDLRPTHQIFIAEVGAYNKGKVKEVCSILSPQMGIVTGVNEQHLALFGSMENLLLAEGGVELAKTLLKDGTLFVNGDNKYCLALYKKFTGNKKIYTLSNNVLDADIWSKDITIHKNKISFLALDKHGSMAHFGANVLGKQNVQNLLGAILVSRELGMSFEEISDACENISDKISGMTFKKGKHGIDIIDSSYSANPDGVFADLDYLSIFPAKKVIVMPCLIELGEKSSEIHEKIGRRIGEICDLVIITSEDKFEEIKKGFQETKSSSARILLCDTAKDTYSAITLFCKAEDAVLLEGRVPGGLINLLEQ